MPDLNQQFARLLGECVEKQGMKLPFVLVVVGSNGSFSASRYVEQDAQAAEPLAQHGGTMTMPLNMMIVDATGKAVRVVFEEGGGAVTLH